MDKSKKNGYLTLIISFCIICFVLCAISFYLGGIYTNSFNKPVKNDTNNSQVEPAPAPAEDVNDNTATPPADNTDTSAKTNTNNTVTPSNNTTVSYVGNYGFKRTGTMSGSAKDYFEQLYLRSDGTFYLSLNNEIANQPSVGKYTVNKDNTITLSETVRYGSDACYFTSNLQAYTLNVKNQNTLTLSYDGITREFTKGSISAETASHLAYYVSSPKNGVTPNGWEDAWKDCTNATSR